MYKRMGRLGAHHPRELRHITETRSFASLNIEIMIIKVSKIELEALFYIFIDLLSKSSTCWASYPLANPNPKP